MDIKEYIFSEISKRMGPSFFTENPPPVYPHYLAKLQKRAKNEGLFRKLNNIYSEIPQVECSSCADICCRESPDVYLIEYLNIRRHLKATRRDPQYEARIVNRSIEWCFIRFVKDKVFCPFLDEGKCSIYEVRPINCRMWALENDDYYNNKAVRAEKALRKQYAFLHKNGVAPIHRVEDLILRKCADVKIEEDKRFSEEEIAALDLKIAFLHLNLIPHESFKSMNFHLHFPGFVTLGKIAPDKCDGICVQSSKEYIKDSKSEMLDSIISEYHGEVP